MRKLKRFARKRKVLLTRAAAIMLPVIFAFLLLSQTAFAKTYVITDGSRVFTYTTYATDPVEVLDEAGLELDENDTYTAETGISTSAITVRRAQNVTVEYHGEVIDASSFGETVEELLIRLNIDLGVNDVVSVPVDTETYDGMELRVDRVIRQEQTYTTTLAHETAYCFDATLPKGVEEVLTPGVDGEMLCRASVTYVNGVETERTVLSQNVVSRPITEVIAQGSGEALEAADPGDMPVFGDGTITLPTGEVLTYTGSMICNATAYAVHGTTATGTRSRVGAIAVDPRVIPYGTRMFIVTNDGQYIYGIATAEDCGDLNYICGNRIDLFFNTKWECYQFGYRECTVYFLGTEE